MAILDLATGTRATVFRTIVSQLKADPVLANAVKFWMVWDDSEWDRNVITSLQQPGIRLTPIPASQGWYSPDAFSGYLQIQCEIGIPSVDADDYLNLWEAIENALYPPGDRVTQLAYQQALRDAGSETGLVEFNLPASDPNAVAHNDGIWWCQGQMRISVIRTINP